MASCRRFGGRGRRRGVGAWAAVGATGPSPPGRQTRSGRGHAENPGLGSTSRPNPPGNAATPGSSLRGGADSSSSAPGVPHVPTPPSPSAASTPSWTRLAAPAEVAAAGSAGQGGRLRSRSRLLPWANREHGHGSDLVSSLASSSGHVVRSARPRALGASSPGQVAWYVAPARPRPFRRSSREHGPAVSWKSPSVLCSLARALASSLGSHSSVPRVRVPSPGRAGAPHRPIRAPPRPGPAAPGPAPRPPARALVGEGRQVGRPEDPPAGRAPTRTPPTARAPTLRDRRRARLRRRRRGGKRRRDGRPGGTLPTPPGDRQLVDRDRAADARSPDSGRPAGRRSGRRRRMIARLLSSWLIDGRCRMAVRRSVDRDRAAEPGRPDECGIPRARRRGRRAWPRHLVLCSFGLQRRPEELQHVPPAALGALRRAHAGLRPGGPGEQSGPGGPSGPGRQEGAAAGGRAGWRGARVASRRARRRVRTRAAGAGTVQYSAGAMAPWPARWRGRRRAACLVLNRVDGHPPRAIGGGSIPRSLRRARPALVHGRGRGGTGRTRQSAQHCAAAAPTAKSGPQCDQCSGAEPARPGGA